MPPKTDTSPMMEIEAAANAGRKLLADATRRITWKGSYFKALARGKLRQTQTKTQPKTAKVTPVDSARKK